MVGFLYVHGWWKNYGTYSQTNICVFDYLFEKVIKGCEENKWGFTVKESWDKYNRQKRISFGMIKGAERNIVIKCGLTGETDKHSQFEIKARETRDKERDNKMGIILDNIVQDFNKRLTKSDPMFPRSSQ